LASLRVTEFGNTRVDLRNEALLPVEGRVFVTPLRVPASAEGRKMRAFDYSLASIVRRDGIAAVNCSPASAVAIVPDRCITAGALWRAVGGTVNEGTFVVFDLPGIRVRNQHLDRVQVATGLSPSVRPH